MRWDLFFSDLFARVLGLIGLVAAIPFAVEAIAENGSFESDMPTGMSAGLAAGLALMALLFLLPKAHDVALRLTRPWFHRIGFLSACIIWAILVPLGIFELKNATATLPYAAQIDMALNIGIAVFLVLFAVLVLPIGYAWRAYRDVHADYEKRRRQQIQTTLIAMQRDGGMAHRNGMVLRKSDFWDNLMFLPLGAGMLVAFYGFKVSTTVQTAELDVIADQSLVVGTLLTLFIFWGPIVAMNLIRGIPFSPSVVQSKWIRRMLSVLLALPLSAFLYVGLIYDGVPAAWNVVHDAEPGTLRYEITDIDSGRRLGGCVHMHLVDQPDRQMHVCNLTVTLRVGDVIDATGPLSRFGHSIETVRIVR